MNAKIFGLMKEKGIKQKEAAEKIGISRTTFNLKLNGKYKFTADEILKLARLLGTTVENLLEGVE